MTGTDERTIQALRSAMAAEVRGHHLDPQIASAALNRLSATRRPPRRRLTRYAALAASVAVVATVAVVYAVTGPNTNPPHPGGSPGGCAGGVVTSALPTWARDGFSPGAYVMPHVTGTHGEIVGALFGFPLKSPPAKDHANKILWVTKDHSGGPLTITARLVGSGQVVTRTLADGPGPSIINMPAPGCWQMTLTWSGHRDTLALPYVR